MEEKYDLSSISKEVLDKRLHKKNAFIPRFVRVALAPFDKQLVGAVKEGAPASETLLREAEMNLQVRLELISQMHTQLIKEVAKAMRQEQGAVKDQIGKSDEPDSNKDADTSLAEAIELYHELKLEEENTIQNGSTEYKFLHKFDIGDETQTPFPSSNNTMSDTRLSEWLFDPYFLHRKSLPRQNNSVISFIDSAEYDESTLRLIIHPFQENWNLSMFSTLAVTTTNSVDKTSSQNEEVVEKYVSLLPEASNDDSQYSDNFEVEFVYREFNEVDDEGVVEDVNMNLIEMEPQMEMDQTGFSVSDMEKEVAQQPPEEQNNKKKRSEEESQPSELAIDMNTPLNSKTRIKKSKSKVALKTDSSKLLIPRPVDKVVQTRILDCAPLDCFLPNTSKTVKKDSFLEPTILSTHSHSSSFTGLKLFDQSLTMPGTDMTQFSIHGAIHSFIYAETNSDDDYDYEVDCGFEEPEEEREGTIEDLGAKKKNKKSSAASLPSNVAEMQPSQISNLLLQRVFKGQKSYRQMASSLDDSVHQKIFVSLLHATTSYNSSTGKVKKGKKRRIVLANSADNDICIDLK